MKSSCLIPGQFTINLSSIPPPPNPLHILILILTRPHNRPLDHRPHVRDCRHEPENHQQYRQRTAEPIDTCTTVRRTDLDTRKCQTGIREDESPPVEREGHAAGPGDDGDRADAEKPEREEQDEGTAEDADDLDDFAVCEAGVDGESVAGHDLGRLGTEGNEAGGCVACGLKSQRRLRVALF